MDDHIRRLLVELDRRCQAHRERFDYDRIKARVAREMHAEGRLSWEDARTHGAWLVDEGLDR